MLNKCIWSQLIDEGIIEILRGKEQFKDFGCLYTACDGLNYNCPNYLYLQLSKSAISIAREDLKNEKINSKIS